MKFNVNLLQDEHKDAAYALIMDETGFAVPEEVRKAGLWLEATEEGSGKFAGILWAVICDPALPEHLTDALGHLPISFPAGYLIDVAVAKEARNSGIATALTAVAMQWMQENDCKCGFLRAWKTSDGVHLAGVLDRLGWHSVEEQKQPWFNYPESLKESCPRCDLPCTCDAVVYMKEF